MRLVLGLGNPGEQYAPTRHNVAWRVLDQLAERWRAGAGERHETFETRTAVVDGHAITLIKPLTFMNFSGTALTVWQERHEVPESLLVVSDDVYLPIGMLRLRARGSSGGHRGLESIEAAIGSREFARLRIGVGAVAGSAGLRDHVLEAVAPDERPALDDAIRQAAEAVTCWATDGLLVAMNRFNRKVRSEESEP